MTIPDFLATQSPDRQTLMSSIHEIILKQDKTVSAIIEPMMGKDMIVYKAAGTFKYGLSGVKKYMSLHVLPIYGSPVLHAKYKALFKNANFQKGCINFVDETELPLNIVKDLFTDCSKIDLRAIREEYLKSRAAKKKSG